MTLPHAEFLSRFEQHILPKNFVKIRHAGYLHAKNKIERIAAVCKQLQLPAPMQRVHTPVALRMLLQTGKDITLCPVCKHSKDGIGGNIYLSSWLPGRCGAIAQPGLSKNKKQKELPMKNTHNPVCNFYRSKNKARFWVRDSMHRRGQNMGQEIQRCCYHYSAVISKLTQNTLQQQPTLCWWCR